MLKINYNETVEICQGDRGYFSISFDDYILTENDLIIFVVKNGDLTLFKKNPFKLVEGEAYFQFDSNDTINIEPGKYLYYVAVRLEGEENINIVTEKEFTIKRGVINEL